MYRVQAGDEEPAKERRSEEGEEPREHGNKKPGKESVSRRER